MHQRLYNLEREKFQRETKASRYQKLLVAAVDASITICPLYLLYPTYLYDNYLG